MTNPKKKIPAKKQNKTVFIAIGALTAIVALILIIKAGFVPEGTAISGENLIIPKSEVTDTAKFYSYKAGSTSMEVLAVKAPDGTIRTAFNTCQVCYDSGRGYYKQEGDELVCQNCSNRFKLSQVEKIKGGCNPVPILDENKTDDGSNITISKDFLEQSKDLFGNWRR
mgnify:FL=1